MTLSILNHPFHYEMENLCRLFFPGEDLKVTRDVVAHREEPAVFTALEKKGLVNYIHVSANVNGQRLSWQEQVAANDNDKDECERTMASALYSILSELLQYRPKWGILTGVRPAKLMRKLIRERGRKGAKKYFKDALLVSEKKTSLCMDVAEAENGMITKSGPAAYSLYIAIPFCPTRCSYCSFVSHSVEKSHRLIPKYIESLLEELEHTAAVAESLSLQLQTVYMGGGTPTVLEAEDLERILHKVYERFPITEGMEFTVEAGRPDTITRTKLEAVKKYANRISINPQTLNDDTLARIGRMHSAKESLDAYRLARKCGFENINMDLIAGLPEDRPASFQDTVNGIIALGPENITLHTLSKKRSSRMAENRAGLDPAEYATVENMLDYAEEKFLTAGYNPYYMYRQSKTVGNFENVGWAKKGYECAYNVYMMDETHTILSCGASAVTKLKDPHGSAIERIFNFKYPYEYISRFSEMVTRKEKVIEFYDKNPIRQQSGEKIQPE